MAFLKMMIICHSHAGSTPRNYLRSALMLLLVLGSVLSQEPKKEEFAYPLGRGTPEV